MSIKKSLKKLLVEPAEMRIEEVISILQYFGFSLKNIKGSHFRFNHPEKGILVIPSHNKKVKRWYLKDIKSKIASDLENLL